MLKCKLPTLLIVIVLLGLFSSCRQKQDDLIDLGLIRIIPAEILFSDSTNSLIDNLKSAF